MQWSFEKLGESMNLGLPIFLFLIAITSFAWFGVEVRKKRIEMKSLVSWLIWNTLYTIAITYILIVTILHVNNVDHIPNIFNQFAHYAFGLDIDNGKQWLILLILAFIAYILVKTLQNSIKIARLDLRIDELNKQVAILMGQVNRTTDFENLPLATKEKTSKQIKAELKEKIKIQKAKIKASEKMKLLSLKEESLNDKKDDNKKK